MLVALTRDVIAPECDARLDGLAVRRAARSHPGVGLRQTVLMSGNPVEREAVAAGADHVIPKSFWPASSAIERLIESPPGRTRGWLAYDAR